MLPGLLLRVAKVPFEKQASSFDYILQQRFYSSVIKPIVGEYAIHQELVGLAGSGIVPRLNQLLQSIDKTRKEKFRGTVVGETAWGFLLDDLRSDGKSPTLAMCCRTLAANSQSQMSTSPLSSSQSGCHRLPALQAMPSDVGNVPKSSRVSSRAAGQVENGPTRSLAP